MTDFDGQIAVVTGAASGIGLGIARAFHDAGASIVMSDLHQDALDQAVATFPDAARLATVPTDVRDTAAVDNLMAVATTAFGPPSVMIANAGIVPNASVLNMDVSVWDATIETNLRGAFLCCQAAVRSMVEHGTRGHIVTTSSTAAHRGRRGAAAYCASKAGIEMLTKVLAMEVAEHRINVNAVEPGVIERPHIGSQPPPTRRMNEAFSAALLNNIPWGRLGTVAEVAQLVLFLCSPAAEYITGAVIPVDGGSDTGWTHMPYSAL